ncbi:MAG: hypothetical protein WD030_06320, partial [Pirellulales bacterium]
MFKVSDNGVVMPVDRIFFNFNHYHNAIYVDTGGGARRMNVDQYTFGVEKTFFDGLTSLEVRIPFAYTADSHQEVSEYPGMATEFGNIILIPKLLLVSNGNTNVAVGLGIGLPTSRDTELVFFGEGSFIVESESVVLSPFLGFNHRLSDRWWSTGYLQASFDCNGNSVLVDNTVVGVYQEQALLSLDLALNYELYFNTSARYFRRVVPTVELHLTTSLQDSDDVHFVSNPLNRFDILNLTAGFHIDVTRLSRLSVAAVVPLRHEEADGVFGL